MHQQPLLIVIYKSPSLNRIDMTNLHQNILKWLMVNKVKIKYLNLNNILILKDRLNTIF